MLNVIGVKFPKTPRVYYYAAGDYDYEGAAGVIVETPRGLEFAKIAMPPTEMAENKVPQPLKAITRLATEKDVADAEAFAAKKRDALRQAAEKVAQHKLDMKLVDIEFSLDASKAVIFFKSENRVDFRNLVKDLAGLFKARIELRQISARDECKMLGGIAPCGRACCCAEHLSDYGRASIKMAKNQGLSLNPAKISGLCGRLMCCLSYENAHYAETNKRMPKIGSEAVLKDGVRGTVQSNNQLKEIVRVRIPLKDGSYEFRDMPLAELKATVTVADEIAADKTQDTDILN